MVMKSQKSKKKTKNISLAIYFIAATTLTASMVLITILEGHRIKRENELLSYEVW